MPDKPAAEITIDESLVRRLVATEPARDVIPDAASLPLEKVAEGWDSEVWRLGEAYAVRVPRRALAAPLVLNEQRVLPDVARRLAPIGVRVPAPVVQGPAGPLFPWAWSVVPWIDGTSALDEPRAARTRWAPLLADALAALHVTAPADHPVNPVRGRPLATRDAVFHERLSTLVRDDVIDATTAAELAAVWLRGVALPAWTGSPVWIHGDLHPGNLIVSDGMLAAIIDFGDVTAGDPAYDLAVAWLAFDAAGRERFTRATGSRYDVDTWGRARAWAAAVGVLLLTHSDDAPAYAALARAAVTEVIAADAG